MNVTLAVWVTVIESVVSVAVMVEFPMVDDFTVKVATPELSVVAETTVMVSVAPRLEESETNFPLTPFEFTSLRVTVIVEVETPSSVTDIGEAETVDWAALTEPAAKVTVAVWVIVTESVASVAVKLGAPEVDDFIVKVATPEAFVVPETVVMVSVAPRLELNVTVLPETTFEFASFKVTVMVEVVLPSAAILVGEATTVD
jgi:hypothetical protein